MPHVLHIIRHHIGTPADQGLCLGDPEEIDGSSGAGAGPDIIRQTPVGNELRMPGHVDNIGDIFLNRGIDINLFRDVLDPVQILDRKDRFPFRSDPSAFNTVHDRDLLLDRRECDLLLDHETVRLGLGKRIGAFLLDGVLGRDDNENILRHAVGLAADRDLPLLHGLQHGALGLGAGPVHLVQKDKIGKNRSENRLKLARILMIDLGADNITGQEIRRTLDTGKSPADRVRDRFRSRRLRQSRHRFQQNMTVRDNGSDQRFLKPLLTDDLLRKINRELFDHILGEFKFFLC